MLYYISVMLIHEVGNNVFKLFIILNYILICIRNTSGLVFTIYNEYFLPLMHANLIIIIKIKGLKFV